MSRSLTSHRRPRLTLSRTLMLLFLVFSLSPLLLHTGASNPGSNVGRNLPKSQPETRKKKDKCKNCAPPGDQVIYIPLMELPEAKESELVFNSRSPETMIVTPTFYKADGTAVVGDAVDVASAEIRYVKLGKLIPAVFRRDRDWGGMTLSYHGHNREMWAQLRFLNVNGGSSVDEFFTVKSESRSDSYEAAWWAPKDSTSIVALGNISDLPTSAVVTFGNDPAQTITLAPQATQIVRSAPKNLDAAESITIRVTGAPGSVVPTGVIASRDGSFNSVIRFYSPKLTKQAHLFANGFRVRNVTPRLVLKNTTAESIVAQPKFTTLGGTADGQPVVTPEITLAAHETREVNLEQLSLAARERTDLDIVSVSVTSSGAPGSLIGSLYGINRKTGVNYDIPLRDSGPVRNMTGSYPWKITKDYTTVIYITNISDREAGFVTQIQHDGQKFVPDPHSLKPGETAVFDVAKIRDEQMPDNMGRRLPKETSVGQFKWAVRGVTDGKLLLIGRAEMVSRSERISTSYSCNDPCPPTYGGSIDPFLPPIVIVGSRSTSVWETAYYDSGFSLGPYATGAEWTIDNPAIGTCEPSSGHTITVCSGSPGSGYLNAFIRMEQDYGYDGRDCYDNYNQYEVGAGQPLDVLGRIDSITPHQGLIGNPVDVIIRGTGFGNGPTVTAEGGINVVVNSSTSTEIHARFNIAIGATGGNHAVTVTNSVGQMILGNFFVQLPTRLGLSIGALRTHSGGSITACNGAVLVPVAHGYSRLLTYTVLDQNGAVITQSGMTVTEEVYKISSNPANVGGDFTSSGPVNGDGTFCDVQAFFTTSPPAPVPGEFLKLKQLLNITLPGRLDAVRVNCLNQQHNDVTITDVTSNPNATCQ